MNRIFDSYKKCKFKVQLLFLDTQKINMQNTMKYDNS